MQAPPAHASKHAPTAPPCRCLQAVASSLLITGLIYAVMGAAGLMVFGEGVKGEPGGEGGSTEALVLQPPHDVAGMFRGRGHAVTLRQGGPAGTPASPLQAVPAPLPRRPAVITPCCCVLIICRRRADKHEYRRRDGYTVGQRAAGYGLCGDGQGGRRLLLLLPPPLLLLFSVLSGPPPLPRLLLPPPPPRPPLLRLPWCTSTTIAAARHCRCCWCAAAGELRGLRRSTYCRVRADATCCRRPRRWPWPCRWSSPSP